MKILIEFRIVDNCDMVDCEWIETRLYNDLTIDTDLLAVNAYNEFKLDFPDMIFPVYNKIYIDQIAFTDTRNNAAYYTGRYQVLDYDCSDEEAEILIDRLDKSIVE